MHTRRQAAIGIAAGAIDRGLGVALGHAEAAPTPLDPLSTDFVALETESGGRLGVAVLDTGSRAFVGHRAGERFPMCSTFKLLAAAAVPTRPGQANTARPTTSPSPGRRNRRRC